MATDFYNSKGITKTCIWEEIFHNNERVTLQDGLVITDLLSVMLSSWLTLTILFTNLQSDDSYRNLANFTMSGCIRHIVTLIFQLSVMENIKRWYDLRTLSCEYFAFFETFLAVFEVECLTHVCIERYVVAKYITNGWQINKRHYSLYSYLCFLFSFLYSVPPLLRVGRYSFDFQCNSCTFDMVVSDTWEGYCVMAIFALRSVKPAIVIIMMLIWAQILESKHICSLKKNAYFTRSVIVITTVNLLCWSPIAVLRGYVLLSNMMRTDPLPMLSAFYIKWAMWTYSAAPAFTAVALFVVDDRVRHKMFHLCWSEPEYENNDIKND